MAVNNDQKTTMQDTIRALHSFSKAMEQSPTLTTMQDTTRAVRSFSKAMEQSPTLTTMAAVVRAYSKELEQNPTLTTLLSGIVGLQSTVPIWSAERSVAGVHAPRQVSAGKDRNETNLGECGMCGNLPWIEQLGEGVLRLSCDPCGYSMQLDP